MHKLIILDKKLINWAYVNKAINNITKFLPRSNLKYLPRFYSLVKSTVGQTQSNFNQREHKIAFCCINPLIIPVAIHIEQACFRLMILHCTPDFIQNARETY